MKKAYLMKLPSEVRSDLSFEFGFSFIFSPAINSTTQARSVETNLEWKNFASGVEMVVN